MLPINKSFWIGCTEVRKKENVTKYLDEGRSVSVIQPLQILVVPVFEGL